MAARDLDTKLTPALYKIFLEYKKATTKVERWLALTSKKENETKERLTIFEMKQAAERIKAKLIKVPDEIYYAFDRAIAARSEVISHFKIFVAKETEARNASHEHFTNTLRALFEFLCPARLLKVKAPIVSTTTLSNSFAKLSTLPIENEAPGLADIEPDECQQSEAQVDAEDAGIKDDDMVQELELHFTLWDLGTTCKTVKGYWRAAAAGSMPIMLAAFLTNAAVASMAYRFREDRPFFDVLDISDYDEIIASHGSPTPVICGTTISSNVDDTLAFKSELYAPTISILLSMKGDGEAKDPGRHMMERPKDYIPALVDASDWPSRITAEMKVLNSLMRTIKRLPRPNGKDESNLVMGFHPSMRPVNLHQYFGPIPTGAAFILRLILESYKGWSILPSGDLSNSNARLHTLRFAQSIFNALQRFQASKSFEPTHGCDCTDCSNPGLLGYVRMFQDDLTAFTSEQSFDLYHQSPVVAGFQMTKLLARATELGTSFRNISQYVGAVLHLYNLLRQYGLIDPEPVLLEHLCMAIGHNIFRGPRPKLNFYSQYAAFQGAALRLDKHTRRWRMDLHGSHTRHLHPHSLCVMAGLNDCGFQPFCNRWAPVWHGIDKHGRVSSAGIYKTADQITAHPLVCALEPLESIVRPEWEGECPVARLNWFEVYQSCTQVLENIADAQCDDPKDLTAMHVHINRNASFRCGKRSVEECLRKADQYPANEFGADYSAENKVARDAIRETFKGKIPRSENKMRCPY